MSWTVFRRRLVAAAAFAVMVPLASPAAWARDPPTNLADLITPLLPAVVNITASTVVESTSGPSEQVSQKIPQVQMSAGSGFIIDPAGYIVTNRHVIDGASHISVTLSDNTLLKAKLVAQGYHVDIALLKVDAGKPLPTVKFGDSGKVRIGDAVVAVGNPLGIGQSVSAGIVSALNRDIHITMFDDFIQTDAAINHGNSGGPLFNMNGEVIGVNTAIVSPTAGSVGIGFALPSRDAQYLVGMLREYGRIEGGMIGAEFQQVTPPIAEAVGLKGAWGAIVTDINKDGPAEGKLKVGDVIVKVGDAPVLDVRMLSRAIATSIEKPVDLVVWRDNKEEKVTVTTVVMDDTPMEASSKPMLPPRLRQAPEVGLQLSPVTDEVRQKFDIDADMKGVVVTGIASLSAAENGGIKPGDVILRVRTDPVSSPAEVKQHFEQARREHEHYVLLLVDGKAGRRWVSLPLGTADL